jgi:hypothetical protein
VGYGLWRRSWKRMGYGLWRRSWKIWACTIQMVLVYYKIYNLPVGVSGLGQSIYP